MDPVTAVRSVRRPATGGEFRRRAKEQGDRLREGLVEGRFAGGFRVGLEVEGYAVDTEGRLTSVPESAFGRLCERELGRHNAELNTPATPFDPDGLDRQRECLGRGVRALRRHLAGSDRAFVTDGMWTIPPPEGAVRYLTDARRERGHLLATNLAAEPRYYALDADITADGPVALSVPGCRRRFDTILVESLGTSMQVHLQVPIEAFVRSFNVALRTTGPVMALATNAPFLPPDLYGEGADAGTVLDGTADLRIPVFESMNVETNGKVRFPRDLDAPEEVVDRILDDRQCAPFLREWVTDGSRSGFAGENWEFLHRQSTCWRWVRPILGPDGPRLEYRPLSAQPSVADVVGFQALVVGLVHGVLATGHPLADLPWDAAKASFYTAAEDGLDADLAWLTTDGERTDDPERIFPDLFSLAHQGLADRGLGDARIADLLGPVEARWEHRTTPTDWKRDRVCESLSTGEDLATAIEAMQRAYIRRSTTGRPFADWIR
jgi:hypothetical protein